MFLSTARDLTLRQPGFAQLFRTGELSFCSVAADDGILQPNDILSR